MNSTVDIVVLLGTGTAFVAVVCWLVAELAAPDPISVTAVLPPAGPARAGGESWWVSLDAMPSTGRHAARTPERRMPSVASVLAELAAANPEDTQGFYTGCVQIGRQGTLRHEVLASSPSRREVWFGVDGAR
jgi:hypothetical protein